MRPWLLLALTLPAQAADTRPLRLTFAHSNTPGAALEVTARDAAGHSTRLRSDARGELQLPAGATALRVEDSHVVLFEGAPPAAAVLAVPEPIRLSVEVRGARGTAEVRVGFGPRGSAAERWRRDTLRPMSAAHGERMLGLTLPPSPARFTGASLESGRFVSGWIAADAPELVAFDAEGDVALRDFTLPATVQPAATVDAGEITLARSPAVEVQLAPPKGDVAHSFVASVMEASVPQARAAEAAAHLAVLDQIDPQLFADLMFDLPMALSLDGKLRLRGLPPLASIELRVLEPLAGLSVERKVTLKPGAPVVMKLPPAALTGLRSGRRGSFRGVVRLQAGAPVAGATVVFSDFPDRRETVTAADGSFRFANVRRDRHVTFFVDASRATLPDFARRTALFRDQKPADGVTLALGYVPPPLAPRVGAPMVFPCQNVTTDDTVYPDWLGQVQTLAGWSNVDVQFGRVQFSGKDMQAEVWVPTAGTWQLFYGPTPFLFYTGNLITQGGGSGTVVLNGPAAPTNVAITVYNPSGFAASGAQVLFSSAFPDPDPFEIDADQYGRIAIYCVNQALWHVWANLPGTAGGSCESDLNLGTAGGIFLKSSGGSCSR